jgi:hypothetical protein
MLDMHVIYNHLFVGSSKFQTWVCVIATKPDGWNYWSYLSSVILRNDKSSCTCLKFRNHIQIENNSHENQEISI